MVTMDAKIAESNENQYMGGFNTEHLHHLMNVKHTEIAVSSKTSLH